MNKIVNILAVLMISFIGADRINIFSESFTFFVFTPFIFFSLLFNFIIIFFYLDKINFKWLNSLPIYFYIYLFTLIISIFLSLDFYISIKRFILIFFQLFTLIIFLSKYSKNQLITIISKASILGSLFYCIFNILLAINWFTYLDLNSSFINLKPDEIAYFIPRLGGYCNDVNRGTVVLLFFTYFLYFMHSNSKVLKLIIFINILFIFFSFSRTVYLMISMLFLYEMLINPNGKRKEIIQYLLGASVLFILIIFYLHYNDYINIGLTIDERLNIFDTSRFSSSGIHFRLIYDGLNIAFNNVKILLFGSGYGTSYRLIEGYYWSGIKYGNFHSMFITTLVECGILNTLSLFMFTFISPLLINMKSRLSSLIFSLFFFNIFYQLNVEPIFWLSIFLFYNYNYNFKKLYGK